MVHRRHGSMVEAHLKARGQETCKYQEKGEIAVGKGQEHKPQPRHDRPEDHHHPDIKPINEMPAIGPIRAGSEFRQRERQRRRRSTQVQFVEYRRNTG